MRPFGAIFLTVLVAAFLFSPAQAEQQIPTCAPHDKLAEVLAKKHGEIPVWRGLVNSNIPQMVEIFANKDGSTWTVVVTDVTGRACAPVNGFDGEMLDWIEPANAA